ncbi:unnamed protein product [Heterobilharzia americana]|nr:unnamed protein product [Heterobilharzia americana]
MAYNEAHRLLNLSQDWFNSLNPEYITNLNRPQDNLLLAEKNSQVEVINNIDADLVSKETYLKILNPDNNGIINGTERVQSIGDEAGHLNSGSSLLPNGGYREDRRNKVIPYTYLDYGPYYSFAPTYDSGASHCTPESNQLLLGTTWLPARTPFVLGKRSLTGGYDIDGCMDDFEITDEVISTVLEMGDQQLAISLAVAENEQRAVTQFICLANAFTRDLIKKRENLPITVSNESCSEAGPESEELKTVEKNEIAENVVEPSVVENISATCDLDSITHHDLVDSNACTHPYDDESNIDSSNSLNTELIKSAEDLNALYCAQYLRLGDTSQTVNLGSTLQPTSNEMAIAHRLTERFVKLAKYTRPQDLVHPYSVRKAMGLNPEEYFLPEDLTSGDNLNYCE